MFGFSTFARAQGLGLALVLVASAGAAQAQSETTAIAVKAPPADLYPQTRAEADRLLGRLEDAASEACGASTFSAPDVQRATRRSACWRAGVARAVGDIANPQLSEAFAHSAAARQSGATVTAARDGEFR